MSTGYIIRFTLIMTSLVALILAGMYSMLKDTHDANEDLFNRRAVLKAIDDYLPEKEKNLSDDEVNKIFEEQMDQLVVDHEGNVLEGIAAEEVDMSKEKKKAEEERKFPLYVYDSPEGKLYLLSVRGSGLWDEIWGTVALKPDLNTIAGVAFDHKAETPGLGAEIKDNPAFPEQFKGKELYNKEGEYVAVNIRKGGVRDKAHDIDVISGATVTSVGVEEMLYKGIKSYQPYLSKIQGGKQLGSLK